MLVVVGGPVDAQPVKFVRCGDLNDVELAALLLLIASMSWLYFVSRGGVVHSAATS